MALKTTSHLISPSCDEGDHVTAIRFRFDSPGDTEMTVRMFCTRCGKNFGWTRADEHTTRWLHELKKTLVAEPERTPA